MGVDDTGVTEEPPAFVFPPPDIVQHFNFEVVDMAAHVPNSAAIIHLLVNRVGGVDQVSDRL
jgi:hypothetical protein